MGILLEKGLSILNQKSMTILCVYLTGQCSIQIFVSTLGLDVSVKIFLDEMDEH